MITELSLHTGGQHHVFMFVDVKDRTREIHSGSAVYAEVFLEEVPSELRDTTILCSEDVCEELYPQVGNWQIHWHQYMPGQWFSKTYPEFESVWNCEMIVHYTGNCFHLLDQVMGSRDG